MILKDRFYHVYNQGNRQQQIFFERDDYLKFLFLTRNFILPICDILAYCLMPNHFHFLINTNDKSVESKKIGNIQSQIISNAFRLLQSSYAQYINKKFEQHGSLFKQKTEFKEIKIFNETNHLENCFIYIHQNPINAGLVDELEDWEFSSFLDYVDKRKGTLLNKELTSNYLDLKNIEILLKKNVDEKIIKNFY